MTNPLPNGDEFPTIRAYAKALIRHVASVDDDGRESGLDYGQILDLIKKKFPRVTYKGPHQGQPMHMTFAELYEVTRLLREEGIAVPPRPPRRRSDARSFTPGKRHREHLAYLRQLGAMPLRRPRKHAGGRDPKTALIGHGERNTPKIDSN